MFVWTKKNLKYALPLLLAVVVLVAIPTQPLSAEAKQCSVGQCRDASGQCVSGTANAADGTCIATTEGQTTAQSAAEKALDVTVDTIYKLSTAGIRKQINSILFIAMTWTGLTLAWAGMFLNVIITFTVQNMALFVQNVKGIDLAWQTIRDIINILFIFILLFIGINTILGSWSNSAFNSKIIPKVLIAALLINFSLFFTKVLIDTSNIITSEFYDVTSNLRSASPSPFGTIPNTGLSGAIFDATSLTSLVSDSSWFTTVLNLAQAEAGFDTSFTWKLLMINILQLVAAFVFIVIAFMFLSRFVILILLMITSPVGVIGMLIPQLGGQGKKWWTTLWGQLLFAPIFMIMMMVVVLIVSNSNFQTTINGATSGLSLGGTTQTLLTVVNVIISYFIVMFLTITALTVAKQTSGTAGSGFVKWGEKLAGFMTVGLATRAGKAVGGFAVRETVGAAGKELGRRYDTAVASGRFGKLFAGGVIDRTVRGGLKNIEAAKIPGTMSLAEEEKAIRERQKEVNQTEAEMKRDKKIDDGMKKIEEQLGPTGQGYDSTANEVKEFLEAASKMSEEQLKKLLEKRLDLLQNEHFAAALAPRHIDFIKKTDLIDDSTRGKILGAQKTGLQTRLTKAHDKAGEVERLLGGKPADVAALPDDVFINSTTGAPDLDVVLKLDKGTLAQIKSRGMEKAKRKKIADAIEAEYTRLNNVPPNQTTKNNLDEIERLSKIKKWLDNADNDFA
jgi:hypothetical protein